MGKVFFNIVGMTCYQYEHPVKRCVEYVDPPRNHLPPWIISATQATPNPEGPRCRRYELDHTKPKAWQFFETVYDETNHRSEMPRSSDAAAASGRRGRGRRRRPLSMLHQLMTDLFLRVVDPLERKK